MRMEQNHHHYDKNNEMDIKQQTSETTKLYARQDLLKALLVLRSSASGSLDFLLFRKRNVFKSFLRALESLDLLGGCCCCCCCGRGKRNNDGALGSKRGASGAEKLLPRSKAWLRRASKDSRSNWSKRELCSSPTLF